LSNVASFKIFLEEMAKFMGNLREERQKAVEEMSNIVT